MRKGTREFDLGSLRMSERDRARIDGFIQIGDVGLSADQTMFAQILWVLHWMARSPRVKPLSDWTVEEVIDFARRAAPGGSDDAA